MDNQRWSAPASTPGPLPQRLGAGERNPIGYPFGRGVGSSDGEALQPRGNEIRLGMRFGGSVGGGTLQRRLFYADNSMKNGELAVVASASGIAAADGQTDGSPLRQMK